MVLCIVWFGELCYFGEGLCIGIVWCFLCGVFKEEFVSCDFYDVWMLLFLFMFEFVK